MRKGQPRRWAMRPFTDKELKVVELRTNGMGPKAIARELGVSRGTVFHRLSSVYKKVGFSDVALLTRWAIKHALDEPVEPDPPMPKVRKKPGRKRIKLGRIRRSKTENAFLISSSPHGI